MQKGKGKEVYWGRLGNPKGYAKGLFRDSRGSSNVLFCDYTGSPKGILTEVKGAKKGKWQDRGREHVVFIGTLKSFDHERDCGFVECPETKALYGCDVY